MPRLPNTSIYGGGGGNNASLTINSPFQTLGAMMQLKEAQMEMEQKRRDWDDEQAIRATVAGSANPEDAITKLWQTHPTAATKYGRAIAEARKTQEEGFKTQIENNMNRLTMITQIAQGIYDDNSLAAATPAIEDLAGPIFGKGVATERLGKTFDKDRIGGIVAWGTKRTDELRRIQDGVTNAQKDTELFTQRMNSVDDWLKGQQEREQFQNGMISSVLSTAENEQQWDQWKDWLHTERGVPTKMFEPYGKWIDKETSQQHARDLGLTSKEREDIKSKTEADDRAERRLQAYITSVNNAGARGTDPTGNKMADIETAHAKALGEFEAEVARRRNSSNPMLQPELASRKLALYNGYFRAKTGKSLEDTAAELRNSSAPDAPAKLNNILQIYKDLTRTNELPGYTMPGFENYKPGESSGPPARSGGPGAAGAPQSAPAQSRPAPNQPGATNLKTVEGRQARAIELATQIRAEKAKSKPDTALIAQLEAERNRIIYGR